MNDSKGFFSKKNILDEYTQIIEKGDMFFKEELGELIDDLKKINSSLIEFGRCSDYIELVIVGSNAAIMQNKDNCCDKYDISVSNLEEDKKDIPSMIYLYCIGNSLKSLSKSGFDNSILRAFAGLYCVSSFLGCCFSNEKEYKRLFSSFMAFKQFYVNTISETSCEKDIKNDILTVMCEMCEIFVSLLAGYYHDDSKNKEYIRNNPYIIGFISDIYTSCHYDYDSDEIKRFLSGNEIGQLCRTLIFDAIAKDEGGKNISLKDDSAASNVKTAPEIKTEAEDKMPVEPSKQEENPLKEKIPDNSKSNPELLINDTENSAYTGTITEYSVYDPTGGDRNIRKAMASALDVMIKSSECFWDEDVSYIINDNPECADFKLPEKVAGLRDLTFKLSYDFWDNFFKELDVENKFRLVFSDLKEAKAISGIRYILVGKKMFFPRSGYRKLIVRKEENCLFKVEMKDVFKIYSYIFGKYLNCNLSEEHLGTASLTDSEMSAFLNRDQERMKCCVFLTELLKAIILQYYVSDVSLSDYREKMEKEICISLEQKIFSMLDINIDKTTALFDLYNL